MASRKVLLVGWDAADWKVIRPLMDAGKMPNVQRLVENGVCGQIATLHPALSPMLWTSIATGKRPFKHGIHGFSEPTPDGRGVQPVTNLSRKSKALWNILHQNGLRSVVIGWWPSHPAEPIDGVMVSDHYHRATGPLDQGWPLRANAVHPPELAETLAGLRVHPDVLTPEMVAPFIPLANEIDQDYDKRLALFLRTLAECMSVHAAAMWLVENRPWDFFSVYFDAIDHFCHGFMKYHPPRQSWIGERDFEVYHNVVSMAYQYHDRMLGELLKRAGDDATVVLMSDHGFHPDHLRPASIPDMPAGPAIEHRDLGILAMSGPGIKKNALLHGASVLDVAPTILALYGLPVGEDMDGKVLAQAFEVAERRVDIAGWEQPLPDGRGSVNSGSEEERSEHRLKSVPPILYIPSWELVPGADGSHPLPRMDGNHPADRRLNSAPAPEGLSQRVAMEQMIALGYIERPATAIHEPGVAVQRTIRELRYNLGEAYQDGDRHVEALEIFSELCAADPDEQRFAVRLFVSCQALGVYTEMRRIVDDMDGRRRAQFEDAPARIEALRRIGMERAEMKRVGVERVDVKRAGVEGVDEKKENESESLFTETDRIEMARWRNLARYQPPVTDYLKAQVLTAEKRYPEALEALAKVTEAHLVRPGLLLQTADLYLRLGRWRDAQRVYDAALEIDPDNAHAHVGKGRMSLRRRKFSAAANSALDALERVHHYPSAHFLLGQALSGMKEYARAAEAFRSAISFNPNFPEAHVRLAALLEKHLGDAESAEEHRGLARRMRRGGTRNLARQGTHSLTVPPQGQDARPGGPPAGENACPTKIAECLVVVTGLPRSGTSMLTQMLAAGGMEVISDGLREPDEDNPRGYLEFEPVKNLFKDSKWLFEGRGKAIKIVAPLLAALPPGLACRVILCERDLEEVLDSQERMLVRRNQPQAATPERRRMLKDEYARTLDRVKAMLTRRPDTQLLVVEHGAAISDPVDTAERVNQFLSGGLDLAKMAAAIDPGLHRNRASRGESPTRFTRN